MPQDDTKTPERPRRRRRTVEEARAEQEAKISAVAQTPARESPETTTPSREEKKGLACPDCNRVFTSAYGRDYHVSKKVCQKKKSTKINEFLYFTLQPGSMFATEYGLVQVVKDDRATSTVVRDEAFNRKVASYKVLNAKRDEVLQTNVFEHTVENLKRRMKLNQLYKEGNIRQDTIFEVAFGKNPLLFQPGETVPESLPKEYTDPRLDPDAHGNRIVECIAIADTRTYENEDGSTTITPGSAPRIEKLYLTRDLFEEIYNPDVSVFLCATCGVEFSSRGGLTYHRNSEVCVRQKDFEQEAMDEYLDELAAQVGQERPKSLKKLSKKQEEKKKLKQKRKRTRRRNEVAVYPSVWVALGFKEAVGEPIEEPFDDETDEEMDNDSVEDMEDEFDSRSRKRRRKSKQSGENSSKRKKMTLSDEDGDPRLILKELEREYRAEVSKRIGPIYPSVFHALGFKEPSFGRVAVREDEGEEMETKPSRKRTKEKRDEKKRKRESTSTWRDEVPIFDVRILVSEVDSGRYSSKTRNAPGVVHKKKCLVCYTNDPSEGILHECSFCDEVTHFECLLQKYWVREPEPGDDIMCSKCIAYVKLMRRRAEKRNQEKKGAEQQDGTSMATGTLSRIEKESVGRTALEMNEILDLIDETSDRLRIQMTIHECNDHQRKSLREFENMFLG